MATTLNASSSSGLITTADTSTVLQLQTNGTAALTIDASANVGIGTSSPSAKLTVSDTNAIPIRLGDISSAPTSQTAVYVGVSTSALSGGNGDLVLCPRTSTTANILFYTGNGTAAERMRIDSSGNLLVGTTSNPDTNRVVIKGGDGNQLYLDNAGSTYTQLTFANNGTRKVRQFFDNSLTRFYIDCNGSGGVYLSSGATSWTAASDERVKDIIEPIENATQKLSTWRTVVGKYKADAEGTRRSFLIAQDVLATFPEAVDTTNADEYGLNYQDTIPLLVKAIQELKALVDTQASTITTLTDRITALEGVK